MVDLLPVRPLLLTALMAVAPAVGRSAPFGQGSQPKILIIQAHVPNNKDGDPNVSVAVPLSKELDDTGRVTTVVWSMTDPAFRDAVASGKILITSAPKDQEYQAAAHAMGVDYVLVFTAYRTGPNVKAEARLLRGSKEEWHDKENMAVALGGSYDPEESAQSVSRTIVFKMQQTVLKGLPIITKVRTPDMTPGEGPVAVAAPVVAAPPDDGALKTSVDALLKAGNYAAAVAALRDAVDSAPFDAKRRTMLIETLMERDPDHAAEEARRAALILPDHAEYRLMAARAWMQAGKAKEAQDELNDAVARQPDAAATRLMLGEVALENLDPERALPHLEAAVKADPSAEALFLRALCRAMLGGVDGMKLDMEAMGKAEPVAPSTDVARRHLLAISVFGQTMPRDAEQIRELIQKAAIKPQDAGVRRELTDCQHRLAARIAFMEMLAVPAGGQKSHDRWLLADKLLAESLVDVQTFISGSDDALTDARMNLGEGLKQADLARNEGKQG